MSEKEDVNLSITTIAGGELAAEFNRKLRLAIEDCQDEERVDKPREITMKVLITPDGHGYYDIKSEVGVKWPVLQRKSTAFENTDGVVLTRVDKEPVQSLMDFRPITSKN